MSEAQDYETRIARRAAREREYGVTCYELQAMLEVDHDDWPKHSDEIVRRQREDIDYTPEEAELAITLIHQWVREVGVEQVRKTLSDTITQRAAPNVGVSA